MLYLAGSPHWGRLRPAMADVGKLVRRPVCAVAQHNRPHQHNASTRVSKMSIPQAIAAGLAGEKISRAITGTHQISMGRSIVATGAGALMGSISTGAVAMGAGAVGATSFAVAAAPLVVPVAVVAGVVALISSLWD